MASGANQNQVGYYKGTGAALEIDCDFDPRPVRITKLSDGSHVTYSNALVEVASTCAGGWATSAVGAITAHTAAQGVSQTANKRGFTVGTSATVNASGVKYMYEAID